jgi:hypothetical protein
MHRSVFSSLTILFSALAIAACGGTDDPNTDAPATNQPTATATTAPEPTATSGVQPLPESTSIVPDELRGAMDRALEQYASCMVALGYEVERSDGNIRLPDGTLYNPRAVGIGEQGGPPPAPLATDQVNCNESSGFTALLARIQQEDGQVPVDQVKLRNEIVLKTAQCEGERGWPVPEPVLDEITGFISFPFDIAPEDQAAFDADTAECLAIARAELGLD